MVFGAAAIRLPDFRQEAPMRKILTATLAVLALLSAQRTVRGGQPTHAPASPIVTAVSGPSWLHHLGVDIRQTNLGRGAGRYGPNPDDATPRHEAVEVKLESAVTVWGGDLYRLNCQACHRASGTGMAPDVKSVLPMVQGSSQQEMAATLGHEAARARADLYHRIEHGGQRMPPREYLQRPDIDVLFSHLTALAGHEAASKHETVSVDRLGEFVVKGTCHICHDATGPRPTAEAMLVQGSIPSLASLLADKPIADFLDKVRAGAPVKMGDPSYPHRGRMPVFYYITDAEIVAAYRYLSAYPPK